MAIESLGTIIYEFAQTTDVLYSGLIMVVFALITSLMISWRNTRLFEIMLLPTSAIAVIVGFKPNIVILLVFAIIFIISSWRSDNLDVESLGKGENPIFENR